MKSFLAGFLLLAAVPTLVFADEPGNTEVLVFASNPQPCQKEGCPAVDLNLTKANVQAQYKWINTAYSNKGNFLGVVVNGDWTVPGFNMLAAQQLYLQLNVPLYFGLGANDYVNNKESDPSNGALAVHMLTNHIQENIKYNKKTTTQNKTVHLDFIRDHNRAATGVGIGSLGYAVELGRNKNIYLIQLNDNGHKKELSSFSLSGQTDSGASTYTFKINPIYDWLETRLEYAAQQNKIIIVSKNSADIDPAIDALLDAYQVNLRFLGVNPNSSPLCANYKYICLGYSSDKELLQLTLSYDDSRFSVAKLKADSSYNQPVTNGPLVIHPYHWPKGEFPIQKQVVLFNSFAGYNAAPSVTYFDPINQREEGFSGSNLGDGILKMNQLFVVDVPKDVTISSQTTGKLTASLRYWSTELLDDTKRKNLEASVVCIRFWGTAGLGRSEIATSMKMGAGGEKESLNFCPR